MIEWPEAGGSQRGLIDGPAGVLEAEIARPDGDCHAAALICHPHPQYAGSMDNKVVFTLMRACQRAGLATLRFNFRGVGKSEGEYGHIEGELQDARAAYDWLQAQSELPCMTAGFSFGSAIALRLAGQVAPRGLITVALPTTYFETALTAPDCPWLAIFGTGDEVIDVDRSRADLRALSPAPREVVLEDAGHFFHGRLTELGEAVTPFCRDLFS